MFFRNMHISWTIEDGKYETFPLNFPFYPCGYGVYHGKTRLYGDIFRNKL